MLHTYEKARNIYLHTVTTPRLNQFSVFAAFCKGISVYFLFWNSQKFEDIGRVYSSKTWHRHQTHLSQDAIFLYIAVLGGAIKLVFKFFFGLYLAFFIKQTGYQTHSLGNGLALHTHNEKNQMTLNGQFALSF